jgi:hypothetical protein
MDDTLASATVSAKPLRRFRQFKKGWRVRRGVDAQKSTGSIPSLVSVSVEEDKLFPSTLSHASTGSGLDDDNGPPPPSDHCDKYVKANSSSDGTDHNTQPDPSATTDRMISPAEKTYDVAKGVWSWAKSLAIASPVLGFAEALVAKALTKAGTSFEDLDLNTVKLLHALDDQYLNPVIGNLMSAMLGAAASSEDFFKPIVMAMMKPLDTIKQEV